MDWRLEFSLLPLSELASDVPNWTLASKATVPEWPYEATRLVATVRGAWAKPLSELTGYEFGTLVSQGFALEWLAPFALEVASRYPTAELRNFEGELAYAILRHADEIHKLHPDMLKAWLDTDLDAIAGLVEPTDEEETSLKPTFRELLPDVRQRYG